MTPSGSGGRPFEMPRSEAIRDRIKDAIALYSAGRRDGALLLLLIASAAASRIRYPLGTPSTVQDGKSMPDREAFVTFLRDEMETLSANHMFRARGFRLHVGRHEDELENILYDYIRKP